MADFTWSPEKVVAGEPVQFTDRSTDEDGEVVAWEWKFGTTTSDKQNPEFTFAAQGATEVSLTVTDNKKGRNTKTVTIDVGRGAISLDLLWSYPTTTRRTPMCSARRPRSAPDREYVYVTSTGLFAGLLHEGRRASLGLRHRQGRCVGREQQRFDQGAVADAFGRRGRYGLRAAGFNEPNKDAGGARSTPSAAAPGAGSRSGR